MFAELLVCCLCQDTESKILNNAENAARLFPFISWRDARLKTVLADLHRPAEVARETINEPVTNPAQFAISFALQC